MLFPPRLLSLLKCAQHPQQSLVEALCRVGLGMVWRGAGMANTTVTLELVKEIISFITFFKPKRMMKSSKSFLAAVFPDVSFVTYAYAYLVK